MKKKLTISGLFVFLLGVTGIAYAACGDSACGRNASGEWVCKAVNEMGDLVDCTSGSRCNFNCK